MNKRHVRKNLGKAFADYIFNAATDGMEIDWPHGSIYLINTDTMNFDVLGRTVSLVARTAINTKGVKASEGQWSFKE